MFSDFLDLLNLNKPRNILNRYYEDPESFGLSGVTPPSLSAEKYLSAFTNPSNISSSTESTRYNSWLRSDINLPKTFQSIQLHYPVFTLSQDSSESSARLAPSSHTQNPLRVYRDSFAESFSEQASMQLADSGSDSNSHLSSPDHDELNPTDNEQHKLQDQPKQLFPDSHSEADEYDSELSSNNQYLDNYNTDPALNKYFIYQSDIANGTLIIDEPGHYIVMEDLSFNPNAVGTQVFGVDAQRLGLQDGDLLDSYRSGGPLPSQFTMAGGPYDPKSYGIGFFAMIAITGGASGSIIDLNGFQIEQSEEHALQQRFFSVIELAGAPFITGQGPHDFGPNGNDAVSNLVIKNGTIGRSAHHGIHGNGNQNILIEDIDFIDYEVAAVALNGVDGLTVKDVEASNRTDVPVLGSYSNARFIRPYVDYLAQLERINPLGSGVSTLNVNGESLSAKDNQLALQQSLNAVFDDIITSGDGRIDAIDSNYHLYSNPLGFVDGNSYGFLTGPVGVQVNGFPDTPEGGFETPSANVIFEDVKILRQNSFVTEVPALSNNVNGGMSQPVIDPIGAAFMLRNNTNGVYNTLESSTQGILSSDADDQDVLAANYKPNVLANAQLLVAKNKDLFASSSLDVSRLSIGSDIVAWAESDAPLSELRSSLDLQDGWIYNVDNMLHVQKGTIGFKMDGVTGLSMDDVSVENLTAVGELGFDGNYTMGFEKDTLTGYNGADAYGFTFSASSDVVVTDSKVKDIHSEYGESFGFASPLDNSTSISIIDSSVDGITASGLDEIGPNPAGIAYEFFNV